MCIASAYDEAGCVVHTSLLPLLVSACIAAQVCLLLARSKVFPGWCGNAGQVIEATSKLLWVAVGSCGTDLDLSSTHSVAIAALCWRCALVGLPEGAGCELLAGCCSLGSYRESWASRGCQPKQHGLGSDALISVVLPSIPVAPKIAFR